MFFSFDQLIRRDGRFALVWKIATRPSNKKAIADRRTVLSVEIPDICRAIMRRIPVGGTTHDEPRTKFSLYLLGQLVYGVVVILERQVAFIELDAKTAIDSCNRVVFNLDNSILMEPAAESNIPRKKRRAKKIDGPVTNMGSIRFDLEDLNKGLNMGLNTGTFDDLDGVGMAMRNQITLADPVPDWSVPNMFLGDELLPPDEQERLEMSNFGNASTVNRAESGSKSDLDFGNLLNVSQLTENKKTNPNVSFQDVRPPGEEFEDLNRPLPNMFDLPPPGPLDEFPDMSLAPPQFNDTRMDQELTTPRRPNDELAPAKRTAADMVQLDPADMGALGETPKKRRKRALCVMDESDTMISWATIKGQVEDYSSLLRPIEALTLRPPAVDSVDAMLRPAPTYLRIPKELQCLYKACDTKKMTLEEAAEIDPQMPVSRGPEDKLWQYDTSSNGTKDNTDRQLLDLPPLDDELNMPGIAFLTQTPEKFKERANDVPPMQLDLQQPLNFDMTDPLANTFLPPNPDFTDNNLELGRHSQLSGLEAARRSNTFGPQTSRLDNRTGSVLLDSEREFGFSGFKDYSKVNDITISSNGGAAAAAHIREAVRNASGEAVSFAELFPPSAVSRKTAARAFSGLLGMIKKLEVEVTQDAPYDDIFISMATTDGAESALDTTLSVEN